MPEQQEQIKLSGTLSGVAERYHFWAEAEQQPSPETILKRRECLRQVIRIIGNVELLELTREHVLELKGNLARRNLSPARQYHILATLKYFLRYCEQIEGLAVFPSEEISFP